MSVRTRTPMLLFRFVGGLAFVLAGSLKLRDPSATIATHRLLSHLHAGMADWIAPGLPLLAPFEILLGVLLLAGLLTRIQSTVGILFVSGSPLAHMVAWWKGIPYRPCHCFGADFLASSSYAGALLKNFILLLILSPNAVFRSAAPSVDRLLEREGSRLRWRIVPAVLVPIVVGVLAVHFLTTMGHRLVPLDVPGHVSIRGTVMTADGKPVPGCVLRTFERSVLAITDEDGQFEIPDARSIDMLTAIPPKSRTDLSKVTFDIPEVRAHENASAHHDVNILLPRRNSTERGRTSTPTAEDG